MGLSCYGQVCSRGIWVQMGCNQVYIDQAHCGPSTSHTCTHSYHHQYIHTCGCHNPGPHNSGTLVNSLILSIPIKCDVFNALHDDTSHVITGK